MQSLALAALPGASVVRTTYPDTPETSVRISKPGGLHTHIDIGSKADGTATGVDCFVLGSVRDDMAVARVCTRLPIVGFDQAGAARWLAQLRTVARPTGTKTVKPAPLTSAHVRLTALISRIATLIEVLPVDGAGASTAHPPSSAP